MKRLGIFSLEFPHDSRVFINEQAESLQEYQPIFLMRSQLKEIEFQGIAIHSKNEPGLKQRLFTLTRAPSFFGTSEYLSSLQLIHAHFGLDSMYAIPLAKRLKIPLITTFHGADITVSDSNLLFSKSLIDKYYLWGRRSMNRYTSVFIAVSRFLETEAIKKGFSKEKMIQHYIGVDTEKFIPVSSKNSGRYILCVGRHVEKKGIETLLNAFSRVAQKHPDVSLIQVGSGPLTSTLHALAQTLGIADRVRFLGALPHEKVLHLMQHAEIFALPSQTAINGDSEALGIVFNEASACGIPIVSTWHGGIPEAVLHEETGLLSPEYDPAVLAANLDTLLSNRALGESMGRQGRDYVCANFNIRTQTTKLESIYNEVIERWNQE